MNDQNPYAAPQITEPSQAAQYQPTANIASMIAVEFRKFLWGLRILIAALIFAGFFLILGVQALAAWVSLLMFVTVSLLLLATLPKKYPGSYVLLVAAGIQLTFIVITILPESYLSQLPFLRSVRLGKILQVGEEFCAFLLVLGFWLLAASIRYTVLWWFSLLGLIGLCITYFVLHTTDRWMIVNPEGTAYELILYGFILMILLLFVLLILLVNSILGCLIPRYAIQQLNLRQQQLRGEEVVIHE